MDAMSPAPETTATTTPDDELVGKLSGTRRQFIRGVAAAGASTAALAALESSPVASLFTATAEAHRRATFSNFNAIAASAADVFEVPVGYRADVLIAWGDKFADHRGNTSEYGFNNDFIASRPSAAEMTS